VGGSPSRQQSSEHSAHFHPAGSHSTLPMRISRHGSPGGLADRLSRPVRRSQTRTSADPKRQNNHAHFRLSVDLRGLFDKILKPMWDRNSLCHVHFIRRKG
jgi:hypothetical protein